jgi:hypothetical protein
LRDAFVPVSSGCSEDSELIRQERLEATLVHFELLARKARRDSSQKPVIARVISEAMPKPNELFQDGNLSVPCSKRILPSARIIGDLALPLANDEERSGDPLIAEKLREFQCVGIGAIVPSERQDSVGKGIPVQLLRRDFFRGELPDALHSVYWALGGGWRFRRTLAAN